jgi:hypothetical protein
MPTSPLLLCLHSPAAIIETSAYHFVVPSALLPLLPSLGLLIDTTLLGTAGVTSADHTAYGVQSLVAVHAALEAQAKGPAAAPAPIGDYLLSAAVYTAERMRAILDIALVRALTQTVTSRVDSAMRDNALSVTDLGADLTLDRSVSTVALLFLNISRSVIIKADRIRAGTLGVSTSTGAAAVPEVIDSWRFALMRERESVVEKLLVSEDELRAKLAEGYGPQVVSGAAKEGPLAAGYQALWAAYETAKGQVSSNIEQYVEKGRAARNAQLRALQQQQ